jgi:hypothetical protein
MASLSFTPASAVPTGVSLRPNDSTNGRYGSGAQSVTSYPACCNARPSTQKGCVSPREPRVKEMRGANFPAHVQTVRGD